MGVKVGRCGNVFFYFIFFYRQPKKLDTYADDDIPGHGREKRQEINGITPQKNFMLCLLI